MWDLPRPGLEPVSPALAGRFSTTAPPGKPPVLIFPKALSAHHCSVQNPPVTLRCLQNKAQMPQCEVFHHLRSALNLPLQCDLRSSLFLLLALRLNMHSHSLPLTSLRILPDGQGPDTTSSQPQHFTEYFWKEVVASCSEYLRHFIFTSL